MINAIGYAILVFVISMFFMAWTEIWFDMSPFAKFFYSFLLALATLLIMWR